ncbi:MAG TPA: hypothetical protein PKY77_22900 [Phycisphaerae bacterium]|nr:hypothetical protein [Phycisphaerae bacterium]HRY71294.1 hypothetical protein [Phycisphaerae bacterium]HSA29758.1 hypothetical protein [Phycisphaerae bacterium]
MLDRQFKLMLETAATLTAEDLDYLQGAAPAATVDATDEAREISALIDEDVEEEVDSDVQPSASASSATPMSQSPRNTHRGRTAASSPRVAAGEYERQRTRESKISTACVGREREKHDWWPLGTELVGRIGSEKLTATVVENAAIKSNRSLLITSGPASGRVCMTPTRAAIQATEHYRQANKLGRGGGVTNGWEFWRPRT